MKVLAVWPHAYVSMLCVCVCSFCPLTCIMTVENMKHCSLVSADVALTTSEVPETVQLLHTDSHLGRVWQWLRCEHVHTQTPTHSWTRSKSPYTSIHTEDISTFPKNAYLSDVQLFLYRGLVVARDLLFQFCKMWTDFKEKFPSGMGVNKHTHQPFLYSLPLFFPPSPPSTYTAPSVFVCSSETDPLGGGSAVCLEQDKHSNTHTLHRLLSGTLYRKRA